MPSEKTHGFIAAPGMLAWKEIQFEILVGAGRLIYFFKSPETLHRPVNQETCIIGADIDQQRFWGDEPLQIGQVDQFI